ncbi:hypothetical protein [Terribacillus halophilus]|jgi:hypothetical protein|uniref:hypothetical protein n=1 Tax=Terribacillus halophilus TaxID=361279 RepID=UPI0009842D2C|nr:hypothetical protein [Terribacillus halophilus]
MKKFLLPIILLAVLVIVGCSSQSSNTKTEIESSVQKEEEKVTPITYKLFFPSEQHYQDFKRAVKDEDLEFAFLQAEPQLDYAYFGKKTIYPEEKFEVKSLTKYKSDVYDTDYPIAVDGHHDFYFDGKSTGEQFYEVTKEELEFAEKLVKIQSHEPVGARNPDVIDADFASTEENFEGYEGVYDIYGSVLSMYHGVYEGYSGAYMDLENRIVPSAGIHDTLNIELADSIYDKRENIEGLVVINNTDEEAFDKLEVMEAIVGLQDRKQALEDARNNAIYERDSFEKIYDFYKALAEYKGESNEFQYEKPLDTAYLKEYKDGYNTYLEKVEKEQKRLESLIDEVKKSKFSFLLEQ